MAEDRQKSGRLCLTNCLSKCRRGPSIAGLACFALVLITILYSCELGAEARLPTLSVISYNVQNLFDAEIQGGEYPEFAHSNWTAKAYQTRLSRTAGALDLAFKGLKTSLASDATLQELNLQASPDIVVLQEIENQNVVDDLYKELSSYWGLTFSYSQICTESGPGPRTAVLSRTIPKQVRTHRIWLDRTTSRLVWELQFEKKDFASLTVFACHWKSKLGPDQGRQARLAAASLIRARIDAAESSNYLIVGDLNEDPSLNESGKLLGIGDKLYNAWTSPDAIKFGAMGSYVYKSVWERIDHILYQGSLGLLAFTACNESVLIDDKGFPRRFIPSGTSGVSDHLPIAAVFVALSQ